MAAALKYAQRLTERKSIVVLLPDTGRNYLTKIFSDRWMQENGYWDAAATEELSPLGPGFARARAEGYAFKGRGDPYHGYYYRILTAQGPDAPGGAYDYVVRGKMIGGFALVAYPAKWGASGVMTFLVNHDGVVFQKDLGPKTTAIARAMPPRPSGPTSRTARVVFTATAAIAARTGVSVSWRA